MLLAYVNYDGAIYYFIDMLFCVVAAQIGGEMPQYNVNKTFADRRYKVSSARTYFYLNEATCERNVEVFQDCLHAIRGGCVHTFLIH